MKRFLIGVGLTPLMMVAGAQAATTTLLNMAPPELDFYALPGETVGPQTFSLTQASGYTSSATSITVGSVNGSTLISGPSGSTASVSTGGWTSGDYSFTGATTAGASGAKSVTATVSVSAKNGSKTQTLSESLNGTTVAPVESYSTSTAYARQGTGTANVGLTVTNIGNGNLAALPGGGSVAANGVDTNLTGTVGAPSAGSGFTGPASTKIELGDGASQTYNYAFSTATRGSLTGTTTLSFTDGNSTGSNKVQTVRNIALNADVVSPTFSSSANGVINTPSAGNTPTLNFGTVKATTTGVIDLTITNSSADANGGDATLTDLSLLNLSLSGKNASAFSIASVVTSVLGEGDTTTVVLDFNPATQGTYLASLSIQTDVGAAYGANGAIYSYNLQGNASAVPELSTWAMMFGGFAGLAFAGARRRRAPRISA